MHRSHLLVVVAAVVSLSACGGKVAPTSSSGTAISEPDPERPAKLKPPGSDLDESKCGPVVDVTDCDVRGGYKVSSYAASVTATPQVHVIGVYETLNGIGNVQVSRRGHHVLVLTSYESVRWKITVAQGAVVDRVILAGYNAHTVVTPEKVRVDDWRGQVPGSAYEWTDSDTGKLVTLVEKEIGVKVASFGGCYRATSFVIRDDAPICDF